MRPILEQFVPRREVAIVYDRTVLFQKVQIANRLRTFEHRQIDKNQLRAVRFRLVRDLVDKEVIFAAVEPVSIRATRVRGTGSRGSEEGPARNGILHVDQPAVSMKFVVKSVRLFANARDRIALRGRTVPGRGWRRKASTCGPADRRDRKSIREGPAYGGKMMASAGATSLKK